MSNRPITQKYTFGVEGHTEKWYLEWMRDLINSNTNCKNLRCEVAIPYIGRSPKKTRLRITSLTNDKCYFLADRETPDRGQDFIRLVNELRPRRGERRITFTLGYCNISFELWMLLHVANFNAPVGRPEDYLRAINQNFGTSFQSLDEFKEERNFKNILQPLTVQNIMCAVKRAEIIQKYNEENGFKQNSFVRYYNENPSLSIHEIVKSIMDDFGFVESDGENLLI